MAILLADGAWAHKLDQLNEPVEICTPDGRRLGFFTPSKPMTYQLQPRISEEELERRFTDHNGKWFTAEEVANKLEELRCSS
jgi:hypothetical protein